MNAFESVAQDKPPQSAAHGVRAVALTAGTAAADRCADPGTPRRGLAALPYGNDVQPRPDRSKAASLLTGDILKASLSDQAPPAGAHAVEARLPGAVTRTNRDTRVIQTRVDFFEVSIKRRSAYRLPFAMARHLQFHRTPQTPLLQALRRVENEL